MPSIYKWVDGITLFKAILRYARTRATREARGKHGVATKASKVRPNASEGTASELASERVLADFAGQKK